MMRFVLLAALLLGACPTTHGASEMVTTPEVEAPAPGSPLAEQFGWLLGRWERTQGIEHWTPARDVLFGVGFTVKDGSTGFFEVLLIEAGEGGVQYVAFPAGQNEVAFALAQNLGKAASFTNPQHDFPKVIRYARVGKDGLSAQVSGDDPAAVESFELHRGQPGRAEALEAADMAFARDTAARGIDGWVSAFDPTGAMWSRRKKARIEGHDAIRETMTPLFANGTRIEWQPIASGMSPAGDLGYTIGTSRFTNAAGEETHAGAYVTIWRRQADGSWKVLFDTGV